MDAVLQALADPIRREILLMLRGAPLAAGQIAKAFPVSRPAVSRHLRVLRKAGLVRDQDVGRERVYELELAPLRGPENYLIAIRASPDAKRSTWERRFRALETEVHRIRGRSSTANPTTAPEKKRKTA